ncbi:MAG: ankyrin repeat domain-containing protein [Granulosicoccus sp.]|nr:ankyrin repeat domain-containing protein [Granulosicoccus sp.]
MIDSGWVLSAAHCVKGREQSLFSVQHLGKEYRVEKIVVHPKFGTEDNNFYDFALIQLKEPVTDGKPAKLYPAEDETGKPVVFVGRGTFGNGRDGLVKNDGKQRGATNTITGASSQVLSFTFDAPETATALEGISGRGDSGGPAFVERGSELFVAGVSSYQDGNGLKEGTYGVTEYYARVSTNIPWVNSVVEAALPATLPAHPIIDSIKNNSTFSSDRPSLKNAIEDTEILTEAFYQSVLLNRIKHAEDLINEGADAGLVSVNQSSLFELALHFDRVDYLDMLLNRLGNANNVHNENSTVLPLLISRLRDDPTVIDRARILLAQGANINVQTDEGDTAVILAGWLTDNVELVRFLIEQGADVSIPNNNGDTPLIDAAYLGKIGIVKLLIDHGAPVNSRNNAGRSALDMARERGNTDVIEVLASR